jgi:hypothetical protein
MKKNLKHPMRDRIHNSHDRFHSPPERRAQPEIGFPAFDAVAYAAVLEILG